MLQGRKAHQRNTRIIQHGGQTSRETQKTVVLGLPGALCGCQNVIGCSKRGGYFLTFCDWRMLPTATDAVQVGGISWRGVVAWNKGLGSRAPHKGYFRHQCEFIVWGTKGPCFVQENGPFPGCIEEHVRQTDKYHIAGKPTPLMEKLCNIVSHEAIILDPFAGSGTTCVAAAKTGHKYIGVEKMPEYFEIANQRIHQLEASQSMDLFDGMNH